RGHLPGVGSTEAVSRPSALHPMLFDPPSHEQLTDRRWSEPCVRAAIAAIATDAEAAFDDGSLWPAHPRDEDNGPLPRLASLYLGASGVIWALHELER